MLAGVGFVEHFQFAGGDEDEPSYEQPSWLGPPQDELGVAVPQGVAQARGLSRIDASRVFHEQHMSGPADELPDGLLRLGLELEDGTRLTNLGGFRRAFGDEPQDHVFIPHGGGGGMGTGDRVSLRPGYWLWPLPPPGPLRVSCEWPLVGIDFSTVELDASALRAASERVVRLDT